MIDEPFDNVADYAAQAREFLVKGREYLAAGDLHQASEKGWGAAAHIAKAVALAQGWQYSQHSHFHRVMDRAGGLVDGNGDYLAFLHGRAEILHVNFYALKRDLDAGRISRDLEFMGELVELLAPLAGQAREE